MFYTQSTSKVISGRWGGGGRGLQNDPVHTVYGFLLSVFQPSKEDMVVFSLSLSLAVF